jgi:hypothetical protein
MITGFQSHWYYTWADIWEPLGSSPDAPADLFSELDDWLIYCARALLALLIARGRWVTSAF